MAGGEETSTRQSLLTRVKSVLPILKDSWISLNVHITNGDQAAIDKWFLKRPYVCSKIKGIPRDVLNPICNVAENGDVETFDKFVEIGFSPLSEDLRKQKIKTLSRQRCIHFAAHNGHLDLVKKLVESYGEDINSHGGGSTCLHWAVLGKHVGVVKWLLEKGADPNIGDEMENEIVTVMNSSNDFHYLYNECYPLGNAFNRGLVEISSLLIDNGAQLNKVRLSGKTLISHFVTNLDVRKITYSLFHHGACMPVRDLFEYAYHANFAASKDSICVVWRFLFDLNVTLGQLLNVPPSFKPPYKSGHKHKDLLQQLRNSPLFTDDSSLAEILLMSTPDSSQNSSMFQDFEKNVLHYLENPGSRGVCRLQVLCCVVVRDCIGHPISEKVDRLPICDQLKTLIRLDDCG